MQIDKCQQNETTTIIYFDGRKDKTLTRTKQKEKWYGGIILEEHYVLVIEPGSDYLTHTTPIFGKAIDIANSIFQVITGQGATDKICAIGCGSTNTNMGCKGGIIHQVELTLGRPLCWFICMLNTNELPLQHQFAHLDGPTSGANPFTGPIGKTIQHCDKISLFNSNQLCVTMLCLF